MAKARKKVKKRKIDPEVQRMLEKLPLGCMAFASWTRPGYITKEDLLSIPVKHDLTI